MFYELIAMNRAQCSMLTMTWMMYILYILDVLYILYNIDIILFTWLVWKKPGVLWVVREEAKLPTLGHSILDLTECVFCFCVRYLRYYLKLFANYIVIIYFYS